MNTTLPAASAASASIARAAAAPTAADATGIPHPTDGRDDARTTGRSLLGSAVLAAVSSVGLAVSFGWPAVLDEPAVTALPAFGDAATAVRLFFVGQLLGSLALVPGVLGLQTLLAGGRRAGAGLRALTAFGVAGAVVQCLGWVRWPLVVPGLADTYLDPEASPQARQAAAAGYDLLNAYAGGALGEHLGWLLQAVWAIGTATLLVRRADLLPRWLRVSGVALAAVWTATLVPAGWLGSDALELVGTNVYTGWYLWLVAVGVTLLRRRPA